MVRNWPMRARINTALEQRVLESTGDGRSAERENPGCRTGLVERLHHQDAVADGQRTRAAGVADCHVCRAARANRRAVYDQRVRSAACQAGIPSTILKPAVVLSA